MQKIDINGGWRYRHAEREDWKSVTLPHDAMLSEPRSGDVPGGKNTGWFEGHDYVYDRPLPIHKEKGVRYVLEFEGVYRNAEVFLNGKEVGEHNYGYTGFYVDITEEAKDGENVLEVRAYNAEQPNSRWYSGAGLYRPAWLYVLPERHILLNGIRIKTEDYASGKVCIAVQTSHGGPVTAEVLDGETPVASAEGEGELSLHIPAAKLWGPETPHLYTCRVRYGEEVREERFGVRQIECSAAKGFCINGERIILRGACVHHDNGLLGACAYAYAEERKVKLLQRAGYNAIRSAHNPCSKALLDACDRLGMLVVDEYVDMWYIHKTKYDYATYFEKNWREDLKDIVLRDYDHPSVVMYSLGNEVSETAQKKGIELSAAMRDRVLEFDDTRPVTCGVNIFFNYLSAMGFGVYSDKKAAKDPKKPKKEKAVGSEFFNKLAGLLGDKTMKLGALLHGSNVFTRGHFAEMHVAGYNYGVLRYKRDVKKYPERVIVGSETFVRDAYAFMETAKAHPALIGDFVWAGIDYLGEVGLGAMEYADYAKEFGGGPGWIAAGSGRLDLTGRETGEALYTKVAFGLLPIAIAVVPANHGKDEHTPSAWTMTNARSSWSWNGCDGKKTRVEVYSCAHTVKLFINSRPVGCKRMKKDCRAVFKVKYEGGCVLAVGYDAAGKELCRTSLATAGEETVLAAVPEAKLLGPKDLWYVRLQYTDAAGNLKPLARGEVHVEVEGGELLALGHACPYNEEGYLKDRTDTYYGEALAIVKPAGGTVKLRAESAFGTAEAMAEVR